MYLRMSDLVDLFRRARSNYNTLSKKYGDPVQQEDEGYVFTLTKSHATLKTVDGAAEIIVTENDVDLIYETPEDLTVADLIKMREMLVAYAEIKFRRFVLKKV